MGKRDKKIDFVRRLAYKEILWDEDESNNINIVGMQRIVLFSNRPNRVSGLTD